MVGAYTRTTKLPKYPSNSNTSTTMTIIPSNPTFAVSSFLSEHFIFHQLCPDYIIPTLTKRRDFGDLPC